MILLGIRKIMIRDIVIYGDERLQQKSAFIEKIDKEILDLIEDMFETMYKANGVGLAAVQIGILKRLIVISVPNYTARFYSVADFF